jgi:hypothetical protein
MESAIPQRFCRPCPSLSHLAEHEINLSPSPQALFRAPAILNAQAPGRTAGTPDTWPNRHDRDISWEKAISLDRAPEAKQDTNASPLRRCHRYLLRPDEPAPGADGSAPAGSPGRHLRRRAEGIRMVEARLVVTIDGSQPCTSTRQRASTRRRESDRGQYMKKSDRRKQSEEPLGIELNIEVYKRSQGDPAAGFSDKLSEAIESLTDGHLKVARAAIGMVQSQLSGAIGSADTLEVEFGVKLGSEVNGVIVSASAESTFTVRLGWKKA